MPNIPQDKPQRKIGTRAKILLQYKLDVDHWEYREETGNDVGRDCVLELTENDEWTNHKIEGQIKGTTCPNLLASGREFSFPLATKTITYALNANNAFVLFYVEVTNENVYYLPIQDYFIANKGLFDKLNVDQDTINVRIPKDNLLSSDDFELQEIARSVYVDGPSSELRKYTGG